MIRFINPGVQPPLYLDTANQRVGIGTSAPGKMLELMGTDPAIRFTDTDGVVSWDAYATTNAFEIAISSGSNRQLRMRNTSSGTISVGIGTANPSASAVLELSSTTQALLFPRLTTTQKNAISSPAAGMVVYDSTLNKLCVYTGAGWETVTSV